MDKENCKDKSLTGTVSRIQHFSTEDGPGIRTTVFLQGCSQHCMWCHNPETISLKPVMVFYKNACRNCGLCTYVCENKAHRMEEGKHIYDRNLCVLCGKCTGSCRSHALFLSGKKQSVSEVWDYISSDSMFYSQTDGGVTISGGEPLLQPEFVKAIAVKCKENGINVIIDTAGDVPFENFRTVLPYTDEFYYDIKACSKEDYKAWTGGDYTRITENLRKLIESGAKIRIRVPDIPGYQKKPGFRSKLAELLKTLGGEKLPVDFLPFHRFGFSKYEGLDIKNPMKE